MSQYNTEKDFKINHNYLNQYHKLNKNQYHKLNKLYLFHIQIYFKILKNINYNVCFKNNKVVIYLLSFSILFGNL